MMRTVFEDDHEAFRESAKQFLDRNVRPRTSEFIEGHQIPREIWTEAGRQGLLGLEIPEEYGGSDAKDFRFNAVLIEEMSKLFAALSSVFGMHSNVVGPYLVDLATDELKERILPGFCSGAIISGLALTEPSGGTDLASLRTTASLDGDAWVIDGSKTFITNGYSGDIFVVPARTAPGTGSRGITLFAVESRMAGFSRGRKLDKVGQEEADTAELFFDRVRVPRANLLGTVDRGFVHMMERLPEERLSGAIASTAHATQIFEETVEYAKVRRAFGQSIGSFQHNKFLLAELKTRLDATQAFVDQALQAQVSGSLTAVDAAKVKWWSAEIQNSVLDACVQIYGGYGYMNEYRVARAWRDARVTKIWAGSNEIMKELIGRDLGL